MTRNATYLEAGLAVLLLAGGFGWAYEHMTRRDDAKLATLHTHTVVRQVIAAEADSAYIKQLIAAAAARGTLTPIASQLRAHPQDTARVIDYIDRVQKVLVQDSTALAAADSDIVAQKAVIAAKDAELHEALKPQYSPRLTTTIAALYDPLNGLVSGAGAISIRVLGPVSLVARVEQRPVLEHPSVRVGVAFSF